MAKHVQQPTLRPSLPEVARYPMPTRVLDPVIARLPVSTLTVVLGACVIPSFIKQQVGRPFVNSQRWKLLAPLILLVEVDDHPVLEVRSPTTVIGMPGERMCWRTSEDLLILTPREEGVEVTVTLASPTAQRGRRPKVCEGWELWLYFIR